MRNPVVAAFAALVLCLPLVASAQQPGRAELLAAHNRYRTVLGLAPLRWSDILAARAQGWADQLAALGRLEHTGPGQNLAMATSGFQTPAQLVDFWGAERRYFRNGIFPAISSTGNWMDVGHYSQIVWRERAKSAVGWRAGAAATCWSATTRPRAT